MVSETSRRDGHYRRGLIMGLTMAEVMVLLLFALLLILGWFVRDTQAGRQAAEAFAKLFSELGVEAAGPNDASSFDDNFRTLSAYAQAGKALRSALGVDEAEKDPAKALSRATELIALGKQAEAALGPNTLDQPALSAARQFIQKADARYRRGAGGQGSAGIWLDGLLACATKCGDKGGDVPPCMAGLDGKPVYIYDAVLRSESIVLRDRKAPQVGEVSAALPTGSITFGRDLSMSEFRQQTSALDKWSRERGCRFYVWIVDETAATAKNTYKSRLRTVGEHFFYYEPFVR